MGWLESWSYDEISEETIIPQDAGSDLSELPSINQLTDEADPSSGSNSEVINIDSTSIQKTPDLQNTQASLSSDTTIDTQNPPSYVAPIKPEPVRFENPKDLREYIQYDLKKDLNNLDTRIQSIKSFLLKPHSPEEIEIANKQLIELMALKSKDTSSLSFEQKKAIVENLQDLKSEVKESGEWIWKMSYTKWLAFKNKFNSKNYISSPKSKTQKWIERMKKPEYSTKNSFKLLLWVDNRWGWRWIENKLWEMFKEIPLTKLWWAFKNMDIYTDKNVKNDVFEVEMRDILKDVFKKFFIWLRSNLSNWEKLTPKDKDELKRTVKKSSIDTLKKSLRMINDYLRTTQYWLDFLDKNPDWKIKDLVQKRKDNKFEDYVMKKKNEYDGYSKTNSEEWNNNSFANELNTKLLEISNDTSLLSKPPIKVWQGAFEKTLELKTWTEKSDWLYIWWDRFVFSWITNISDIKIGFDKVTIYWKTDLSDWPIILSKEKFMAFLKDAIMDSKTYTMTDDWKVKFGMKYVV